MASAIPYAAVTPISGAPRTVISRMAAAASAALRSVRTSNSNGRRVWSMTATSPLAATGQIVR
jgi:hypothetical protein